MTSKIIIVPPHTHPPRFLTVSFGKDLSPREGWDIYRAKNNFNIRAPLTKHKHPGLLKRSIKFAVIVILYDNLWWLGTKSQRKRYSDILVLLTLISHQPRHFETAAAFNFFLVKVDCLPLFKSETTLLA